MSLENSKNSTESNPWFGFDDGEVLFDFLGLVLRAEFGISLRELRCFCSNLQVLLLTLGVTKELPRVVLEWLDPTSSCGFF